MAWNKIVGANVRRLRVKREATPKQLAHDANIDVTYLPRIAACRCNPSIPDVGRVAAENGCYSAAPSNDAAAV